MKDKDHSSRVRTRIAVHVFIAHSKMQCDQARILQQALNPFGYRVRLDLIDMSVGKAQAVIESEICAAFEWATHVVVLATSDYVALSSRYCRYEIELLAEMPDGHRGNVLVLKDDSAIASSVFLKELSKFKTLRIDVADLDPDREVECRRLVSKVVTFLDR